MDSLQKKHLKRFKRFIRSTGFSTDYQTFIKEEKKIQASFRFINNIITTNDYSSFKLQLQDCVISKESKVYQQIIYILRNINASKKRWKSYFPSLIFSHNYRADKRWYPPREKKDTSSNEYSSLQYLLSLKEVLEEDRSDIIREFVEKCDWDLLDAKLQPLFHLIIENSNLEREWNEIYYKMHQCCMPKTYMEPCRMSQRTFCLKHKKYLTPFRDRKNIRQTIFYDIAKKLDIAVNLENPIWIKEDELLYN